MVASVDGRATFNGSATGLGSAADRRLLLELRAELGIVLSVMHFNHKIRGAEAEADEAFVNALCAELGLELRAATEDVPVYAKSQGMSLEEAARQKRYQFFNSQIIDGLVDCVATAHTLDDQAETVLMRLMRGAGTRGLAGILPELKVEEQDRKWTGSASGRIVRPLLGVRRREIEEYLRAIGQAWREDASNRDPRHTRNRVRHELLPLMETFNPEIAKALSETAEIARGEEEFWDSRMAYLLISPANSAIPVVAIAHQPVALQRRLIIYAAERDGLNLEFGHVEAVRELLQQKATLKPKRMPLPAGYAELHKSESGEAELRFLTDVSSPVTADYEYKLAIPGEVVIPSRGKMLRARVEAADSRHVIDGSLITGDLVVRNWRPGDRFQPAHTRAPKKVKELLQKIPAAERKMWPVVVSGKEIVWMPGFPPAAKFLVKAGAGPGLVLEEVTPAKEAKVAVKKRELRVKSGQRASH
jgi:tRNA(Ile)-lysidine synthase